MGLGWVGAVCLIFGNVLALHSHPENSRPRKNLVLVAEENPRLDEDPSAVPVTFYLRQGGPQDLMLLPPDPDDLGEIKMWQIQIFNGDGLKVGFVQGKGHPTSTEIPWSGFSDSGKPLPDGFYKARFVWVDFRERPQKTAETSLSLLTPPWVRKLFGFRLKLEYDAQGLIVRIADAMIFNPGQTQIGEAALPALEEIAFLLRTFPRNRVIVNGYTDSTGDSGKNLVLSHQRAYAVYHFLIDQRLDPERLAYEGKGSREPLASNATPEGRAKNRRVEVVVLKASI